MARRARFTRRSAAHPSGYAGARTCQLRDDCPAGTVPMCGCNAQTCYSVCVPQRRRPVRRRLAFAGRSYARVGSMPAHIGLPSDVHAYLVRRGVRCSTPSHGPGYAGSCGVIQGAVAQITGRRCC